MGMEQVAKVRGEATNGDEFGHEWREHFVLYRNEDDDGVECFDLYEDDGAGNGAMVCRGYHHGRMRSLTLALGELIEWKAGVPLVRSAA